MFGRQRWHRFLVRSVLQWRFRVVMIPGSSLLQFASFPSDFSLFWRAVSQRCAVPAGTHSRPSRMVIGALPAKLCAHLTHDADRARHWNVLISSVVILGLLIALGVELPGSCLVRSLVGLPCPFCGVTHATVACLRGHLLESWHIHPAGSFVAAILSLQICGRTAALVSIIRFNMTAWLRLDSLLNGLVVSLCVWNWVNGLFAAY